MKRLLLIPAFAIVLLSCSKEDDPLPEPQSSFTASESFIEKGETVQFTNSSTNAVRYEWDFGNGESSVIKNPTMKFDEAGSYTVTLSAYNEEEKVHSSSSKVEVKAKPEAISSFYTADSSYEYGKAIEFINSSVNAVRYEWDFGNGKTSANENPSIVYDKAGSYKVTLAAYNEDNVVSNYSANIFVGKRYIVGFNINAISFLDGNGHAWDTSGEGPDLVFLLNSAENSNYKYTEVANNVKQSDLSFGLPMLDKNVELTDAEWEFYLYDYDDDLNGSEFMASWKFNPKESGVNGVINMTGSGYNITLIYEIR